MNLGDIIKRSARYWPDRLAVIDGDRRVTYQEFHERTNRLASALAGMGLEQGDHVAVQGPNSLELIETEVALYKAGMVKVPINARLSTDETVHVINDGHPKLIICGPQHAKALAARQNEMPTLQKIVAFGADTGDTGYEALLESGSNEWISVNPDDSATAVLHYTSGSSGVLKAAMQTYGGRRALVRKSATTPITRIETQDVLAHVGPITHASGMQMMGLLRVGACNLMKNGFDVDDLLQTVQDEKVTRLILVPTMVNRIVNHPGVENYDLSSLRNVSYGAAPMAPALVEKAFELFGPILSQGYGAGEVCSAVTILTEQDHIDAMAGDKKRLASCGRCYFEADVRVVNDDFEDVDPGETGEIVVSGPGVMAGYYNAPDLTAEVMKNGYYLTGDLATVDEEGYIFIVDRKKEMIISGGFNVYPNEVEKALYQHDSVFEAAVVGVPDEEWGEAVKAVVVVKPGHELSAEQVIEYCKEHLPGFKRPRSVDFAEELPKNPNGKVVRRLVRDAYWQNTDRKVN